jgi:DNA-binding response OmpR family regulator
LNILLVEDDENLGFVIQDMLEQQGFTVNLQKDGLAGRQAFEQNPPDLCVLDVMLPGMDGFTLAQSLRESGSYVPILFLTAKSLKEDRLKGFKVGGDDYLTKPFSIEELVLRIKAILRRVQPQTNPEEKQKIGSFLFDHKNLKLWQNSDYQELTQREADLLRLLLENSNQIVAREKILLALWGENDYFKGRSLDVFIARLRKYFAPDASVQIVNVHGVGFRLEINE